MANLFFYGRDRISGGESNRSKKRCYSKLACERVKKIYTGEILPICPLVREVVNKEKFPNIPNLPKTSSKNSAIRRILEVFRELIARRQPTKEFITRCAHRDDVLQGCMNLIEKDLKLLPKRYEKDYPKTSQKLEKLIKRLHANVSMYHSAHNFSAFMLPPIPDKLLKDYRDVLAWQEEKENPDESLYTFLTTGEISGRARLICHYPAAAIQTMNRISEELLPLAQIEIEEAKHRKITSQQAKPVEEANNAKKGLTKAEILAYQSYNYAISKEPKLADTKDDEIYNWLKENGIEEYELPSRETWKRQVRSGRKHHGTQKNTPRAGRTSRSIVIVNQIKYTSSQKAD